MATSRQVDALENLGFLQKSFAPLALDLTDASDDVQFDVGPYWMATVDLAGSDAIAIIEAKYSLDGGARWNSFAPALKRKGSGLMRGIPIHQANALQVSVDTNNGAGASQNVTVYADQTPLETGMHRQLTQLQVTAGATDETLYAPGTRAIVTEIWLSNAGSTWTAVDVYYDEDGATRSDATAICVDMPVWPLQPPVKLKGHWPIYYPGEIGIEVVDANFVTATVFGVEW